MNLLVRKIAISFLLAFFFLSLTSHSHAVFPKWGVFGIDSFSPLHFTRVQQYDGNRYSQSITSTLHSLCSH